MKNRLMAGLHISLLGLILAGGFLQTAHAVPAWPGAVEVVQPDGTRFMLRLHGDEFFSWNTTDDGYAVVKDNQDGFWKYAVPASGKATFEMVPGARVGTVTPDSLGILPNVLPAPDVIRRHTSGRFQSVVVGSAGASVDGIAVEPPVQPIPVSGTKTIRNIVILACFSDHWNAGAGTVSASYGRTNVSEYNNLFNQVGHTTDGAVGSVRDYYDQVSYNKLTVESVVSVWVLLPQNQAYYGANDVYGNDDKPEQMTLDAVNAADAAGFDFSQGDSDGDGWVDCLTIIHSGHAEEYSGNPANCIWSHQWAMTDVVTKDGVKMMRYHTEAALRGSTSSTYIIRIGVICHEMGHFFGLPDLYDYSSITFGLGYWGLMATGSWNGSDGKSPAHLCAWSKYMLGFVRPVHMHSKTGVSLPRVEDNAVVHLYRDGMSNGEYYLVENRVKTGFDNTTEIYPGILIYHIDSKSSNNDLETWGHPAVKIEEADGNNSLGARTSRSQSGDAWSSTSGLAGGFRDQTGNQNTNAMLYQTAYYSRPDNAAYYSYNRLNTFSATGNTMTYNASTLKAIVESQSVITSGYTVNWGACSNATAYEIQEGAPVVVTSFSDGAESEDAMFDKWYLAGTVQRSNAGARSGSYSYVLQYYDTVTEKWYSSTQSLTLRVPFKVTTSTAISFYMVSRLSSGLGYLKCEISKDNGNTWIPLGSYAGLESLWTQCSFNYAALTAAGISANDVCLLRFLTNFERASGWEGFASCGYGIDDISITNTQIDSYGNWVTLNNNVLTNSYDVSGKVSGTYAYQVRAYANSTWQGYGEIGVTTVNATVPLSVTGPTDISLHEGENYAWSVTIEGGVGEVFCQWQRLDGAVYTDVQDGPFDAGNYSGAATGTLFFTPFTETMVGTYRVEVADDEGTIYSSTALVSFNPVALPVAGMLGLVILATASALGGAMTLRRRQ